MALSQPFVDEVGVAEYRLTLDPEGKAVLEAALGPLSAPEPVEGERDLRWSDRRRGEALVTLVRRGVAAADKGPRHTKSQLFVTVDLETLRNGVRGAGVTVGGPEAGVLLAPETVRRLACDATIIPTVMGAAGAVVDLGMDVRLFSAAQVKRLWLRDRHCTYPGCAMPASWCDAHHLVHWADAGPTDLDNAALLCERHHTIVHQRRYAGRLGGDDSPLGWNGTVGRLLRRVPGHRRGSTTSVTPPRTPPVPAGPGAWLHPGREARRSVEQGRQFVVVDLGGEERRGGGVAGIPQGRRVQQRAHGELAHPGA